MTVTKLLARSTAGFGLERIGLVALANRGFVLVLVAVATAIFGICASQLEYDSDTRVIFRSERVEYTRLKEVARLYPDLLNQVLVLVEGEALQSVEGMEALRRLHIDLTLADSVREVSSLFTARTPPKDRDDVGEPFLPDPIPEGSELAPLHAAVSQHPLVDGKLLAADGRGALLLVTLEPEDDAPAVVARHLAGLRTTAEAALEGSGLSFGLSGLPYVRDVVIQSLQSDQQVFISIGVVVGWLFAFLFFRELKYVVLINVPVTVALVALLGGTWLAGQQVNVLTSMVTPLIMVIALASALHLAFSIRRELAAGETVDGAIRQAVLKTGPGCVLSALTTALALLSLVFTPYPFIGQFGITAIAGTLLALFSVLLVLPPLAGVILLRWPTDATRMREGNWLSTGIDAVCLGAASAVGRSATAIVIASLAAVAALGFLHLQNAPRFAASQNLPGSGEAFQTLQRIDETLAGTSRVSVLLRFGGDGAFPDARVLEAVSAAHELLESTPWIRSVWSLDNIARWARTGDGLGEEDALAVLRNLSDELAGEVLTLAPRTAMVTGFFPETDTSELYPRMRELARQVEALDRQFPEVAIELTGVSVLEATASYDMIEALNRSLLTAIALIILLIGIALRSTAAGLISILPNLFPIVLAGAYLNLIGAGLQFTSVVAFTIGFGIAVDSTIHFFNHHRNALASGLPVAASVDRTIRELGPVLVVSSIIMAMGIGATLLSQMPLVRLYGEVSIIVLAAALFGDLMLLPALLKTFWKDRLRDVRAGASKLERRESERES